MIEQIKQHLIKNQITFYDHFTLALISGFLLMYASIASIIHAFIPCLFSNTAAKIVAQLYYKRIKNHPNESYRNFR